MVVENRCNDIIEISGQKTKWQKPLLELHLRFTIEALCPLFIDLGNLAPNQHLPATSITVSLGTITVTIKPTRLANR